MRSAHHQRPQCKILSVYSHKGGVGKTTLAHTIADYVRQPEFPYRRVLLVDLDTQMNLTCKLLQSEAAFESYIEGLISTTLGVDYSTNPDIKSKLSLLISRREVNPNPLPIWEGQGVRGRCIHLLPGYHELTQYSRQVSLELTQPDAEINNGAAIRELVTEYVNAHHYDLVIIDLGPDLYDINSCALWSSDFVIIPCTADMYSAMSFRLIRQHIFPLVSVDGSPPNRSHSYYRMNSRLQVLGFVPNRVKIYEGMPTASQAEGIAKLYHQFRAHLGPYFREVGFGGREESYSPVCIKAIGSALTGHETQSLQQLTVRDQVERDHLNQSLETLMTWLIQVMHT